MISCRLRGRKCVGRGIRGGGGGGGLDIGDEAVGVGEEVWVANTVLRCWVGVDGIAAGDVAGVCGFF